MNELRLALEGVRRAQQEARARLAWLEQVEQTLERWLQEDQPKQEVQS